MQAVKDLKGWLALNLTHCALSGQRVNSQSNTMHEPPGWDVSHKRSPVCEQSALVLQPEPIEGAQEHSKRTKANAAVLSMHGYALFLHFFNLCLEKMVRSRILNGMANRKAIGVVIYGFLASHSSCTQPKPQPPKPLQPKPHAGPHQMRTMQERQHPPAIGEKVILTETEWRERLTAEQYAILRDQRTEPSFSCELWQEHRQGAFACAGCGAPLFHSKNKFESGTGWPSFTRPVDDRRLTQIEDRSHGMLRTEVRCASCDGHLGHVFDDGPQDTSKVNGVRVEGARGQRYCINGTALVFTES